VLSGRVLCDELITRPEESYRLCCVVVCDLETSRMGAPYIYDVSRLMVLMGLPYPHRENSTHCREHRDFPTQGEEKQKIVSEPCDG